MINNYLFFHIFLRNLGIKKDHLLRDAPAFLDILIQDFTKSEIIEFIPIASMLVKYKEYILNSFHTVLNRRISNGPMENMNGRIDKIELVSNGVRNFQRLRCRALYCFNKTINFSLNSECHSKKIKIDPRGPYKK
ncbi:transposase [Anaerorhabdus sp.]|uniref:transposase n=1 Tax=Anaerorhabdus sp. TaxID=1872524 RepID=UPI003AA5C8EC